MTQLITRNDLARMYPRAPSAWLDAFIKLIPILFDFYGITRLRWVHFLGQIAAETDGLALNPMRENMGYDAAGLLKHFSYRLNKFITDNKKRKPPTLVLGRTFTSAASLANAIQYKKELIADIVYGNREGTPWMQGHLYIGRGPTQCTHLNGYKSLQAEIARQPGGGVYDLVSNPDLLATDPELGVRAAFANFEKEGLWMWCDRDDCDTLSDALNTGNTKDNVKPFGLPRRRSETARAKAIWPADAWKDQAEDLELADAPPKPDPEVVSAIAPTLSMGSTGPDVVRLQRRLSELGFQVGQIDEKFGKLTKRALVAFQAEHDLVPDGVVGPRTWDVLAQADKPEIPSRENVTAQTLLASGSKTIWLTQWGKRFLLWVKGLGIVELFDQYFNLGFLDSLVSKGEQVKSIATRSHELASGVVPEVVTAAPTAGLRGVIIGAVIITMTVSAVTYLILSAIQKTRVKDAREGNNLAR